MGKFTAGVRVLLLVVVGHLLQQVIGEQPCSATGKNGIDTCVCNIMDACDELGNTRANWSDSLPENVEQFGLVEGVRNLAYLCEHGAVAILYDCNSRIPLYAATKITGDQLSADSIGRPPKKFRKVEPRNQLANYFQQKDADYKNSNNRELCFKTNTNDFYIDDEWLHLSGNSNAPRISNPRKVCPRGSAWLKTIMNKGHLIASQDGRAVRARMVATFTYTNAVPQFGLFNMGSWKTSEMNLIRWGQDYCTVQGAQHVQMFIIVGAIPSTNFGQQKTRYFGKEGFSDYKHTANYPVNVPRYMWTAACCKYDLNGVWKYNSTAFYRQNHPGNEPCSRLDVASLSTLLRSWAQQGNTIKLFPHTPQCEDTNNYVPLP